MLLVALNAKLMIRMAKTYQKGCICMSILTKNAHTNNYLTDEYKNDAILHTK